MSIFSDDDVRYDDDYSHFRQLLAPTPIPSPTSRESVPFPDAIQCHHEIKIVKPNGAAIVSGRRDALLRRIGNAQSEIGRLNKLLDEIRADVLHLTTE